MSNEAQQQKNRDNVNNAAKVAKATGNPYAVAVGNAIQAADNLSGGKASENLGKAITAANKMSGLKGKMAQKALNRVNESGTGDRIASAMRKKNSQPGKANLASNKNANLNSLKSDKPDPSKRGVEEELSDGGGQNVRISFKVVKTILIASIPVFIVVIFCGLFIAASQTLLTAVGLGQADNVSSSDAAEKISNLKEEDLDKEIEEDAFYYDVFIDESYAYNTLSHLVLVARKYDEADLSELRDFYSGLIEYSDEYDMDMVYDFYFKLYDVYHYYKENYKVSLDMPLLMSTLNQQSTDRTIVFSSNIKGYNRDNKEVFNYFRDWSAYKPTKTDSSHDIEILAQNMVSNQAIETCVSSSGKETKKNILRDSEVGTKTLNCAEGEIYKVTSAKYSIDNEKYKEFLKKFLEEKYYINDSSSSGSVIGQNCSVETPFKKYDLTSDQLLRLTSLAITEQGTTEGAAAEASLMANLFELRGSRYGTGGNGLYNYVANSGWFASDVDTIDTSIATDEAIEAVRAVLVYGKRTLPGYIDEHDCIICYNNGTGDITSVTNDGESVVVTNKENYKQHISVIKNRYGSTYTFYSFPTEYSDPFGYTSKENRETIGDFYYDFDTGTSSDCSYSSSNGTDLSSAFVSLATAQLNDPSRYGGEKFWRYMGFDSRVAWCASYVSWVIGNAEYNGQKLNEIIKHQSATVSSFIDYFYFSEDPNINFYYNDNCSTYKGKNGNSFTYTPKEGDLIFFDWQSCWIGDVPVSGHGGACYQDHIGIVQYVEDGAIVTIEGNMSNSVNERRIQLNSCQVIGFGSWY